jgi:RNA polymerase sigma-70 factor (ECF subfamily)
VHAERARGGRVEWKAIVQFYAQLIHISPTIGRQTGYAAALAEASGPEQGLAALDSIDRDAITAYQPYWAVRAHLLQRLGRTAEASDAYDRAIGLAEDPAIRRFLLEKRD